MFVFPWSNLHELNLDWILAQVKKFSELIPPMSTAVEDVQALQTDVEQAVEDANAAVEDAAAALETAEEAKEIAEQAAQGTIADGAVTTVKLDDGAVTTAKIDDGAVTGAKIANATIQAANLASGCVTTTQILDGTISPDDLGVECVTNSKIGAAAVTTAKIDDGAVTTDKLSSGAVTNAKISDRAVSAVKQEVKTGTIAAVNGDTDHIFARQSGGTVNIYGYSNVTLTANSSTTIASVTGVDLPPNESPRTLAGVAAHAYDHPADIAYITFDKADGYIKVNSNISGSRAVWFSITYTV